MSWTREQVLARVAADFPAARHDAVIAALDEYPGDTPAGRARLQLAVLDLARGDIARVRELAAHANVDYRDVLYSANNEGASDRSASEEAIARAFSGHDFASAYEHMAQEISWTLVGGERLVGRDAVVRRCEESAAYIAGVTTRFAKLEVLSGGGFVVVESEATFTDDGGDTSIVASCDVYRFSGGMLSAISSYNVELPDD
jgi:hypothetical protein